MNFHSFMAPVSFQVSANTASFWLENASFNVSFQLTPISIATSFPHGNYLILYLILPW